MDPSASAAALIGSRFGPYQIVELLAQGGMGAVYKAHQPALQRHVALKTLPAGVVEEEDTRAHFHREAEIIARLEHPNILPIFDYGEQGTTPYLVMPLIGGGTLLDWDPGPLSAALQVVSRTLSALEYAHAQNVIHRDIKPTNILMHHGEWPLIADFGLAQIVDPRRYVARTDYSVGTPGFMPPEQILGKEMDHRVDLYAMGVILFAVLTGRLPFEEEDVDTLLGLHLDAPVPSPREFNPDLAAHWDEVIQRSMAKDPDERYPSARLMDAAIQAAWDRHCQEAGSSQPAETIDPRELCDQAALALAQSDWPRVIALCGRILEADPSHHAATYLLSQAQETMRRQRAAQLVHRADESLAAGRVADARRSYQVALALVPGLALARGGLERVFRAEAQEGVAAEPAAALSEEASAWYEQGVAALAHQDWTEAIAALRQAVALAPHFPDAGLRLTEAEQALAAAEAQPADVLAGSGLAGATAPAAGIAAEPGRAARAPGDVLLADHFGSAEFGCLPVTSPEPACYRVEYGWGQYAIAPTAGGAARPAWVRVPGSYADAALVVDAQVRGDEAAGQVLLCCRGQDAPDTGYQLHVAPAAGRFALYRCHGGRLVVLADWQQSAALRANRPNRLELSAAGATLTAAINGLRVAAVRDDTYAAGGFWIGAAAPEGRAVEVVLAGFQVVQR